MPKCVSVCDSAGVSELMVVRCTSSRGATHGLIENTGLGIVSAMPMPTGTCTVLVVTGASKPCCVTLLYPAPAWSVTESGISGPPRILRFPVAPTEFSADSPLGFQWDTLAVTPNGPNPAEPVTPTAHPFPAAPLGNPASTATPMPVPIPALRTGSPATCATRPPDGARPSSAISALRRTTDDMRD